MIAYLGGPGFLGTHGSVGADLALVVMVAAFVMLSVGVLLARARRYEAHRRMQTAAVCLNAIPVVAWMVRSFWLYVLPGLPGNLGKQVDALTTVHAATGLVGVAIGVFVVVRGSQLEARGASLSRYKTAMRVAYVLYLLGTALGVWVYIVLYG
ncbi:MAG: hypothetical protein WC709_01895 [Thermoleophilia bacterium]